MSTLANDEDDNNNGVETRLSHGGTTCRAPLSLYKLTEYLCNNSFVCSAPLSWHNLGKRERPSIPCSECSSVDLAYEEAAQNAREHAPGIRERIAASDHCESAVRRSLTTTQTTEKILSSVV